MVLGNRLLNFKSMTMYTIRVIVILLVMSFLSSCKNPFADDEELSFERTLNTSSKIRLDGYYFSYEKPKGLYVHVYYQNGVVYFTGGGDSFDYFESEFKKRDATYETIKSQWGLYVIKDDSIFTNGLALRSGMYHYTETFSNGVLLNDTTIIFLSTKHSNGDVQNRSDTLHFKQFSSKPDSTNVFIK